MDVSDKIIAKMKANPDRGTPCRSCLTTAKDCQIEFLLTGEWCCSACRSRGGRVSHA